jgi:hypothetical protein
MTISIPIQRGTGRAFTARVGCFGLLILGLAVSFGPPAQAQPVPPPVPSQCVADSNWFTSPSFPLEVPQGGTTNCGFHQFAWQGFIDLVQPVAGQPTTRTFETFMPDYGMFVKPNVPVTPWGQQPPAPCGPATGQHAKRLFVRPRVPKGAGFDPDSQQQAGLPGGPPGNVLYDQAQQVVHYSIAVNQAEYEFITLCNFNDTSCILSAPVTTAITPGAIEIKGSWRLLSGPPPKDMYTVQGIVAVDGGKGAPLSCKPVTLGLVGFHLVANTPLHPEFVWATFEHHRNAPDCTNPQPTPPGGWSFNNPKCPAGKPACTPNQPLVKPTQVCRVAPRGGGSDENVTNIKVINASIHANLAALIASDPKRYGPMKIWQNYDLTGNVWTLNGQLPATAANERGSLLAANATLETFVQGQNAAKENQNCFTCHTESQFVSKSGPKGFVTGAPANLSHLWGFAQRNGGCDGGKGPLPTSCPVARAPLVPKKATTAPVAPPKTK